MKISECLFCICRNSSSVLGEVLVGNRNAQNGELPVEIIPSFFKVANPRKPPNCGLGGTIPNEPGGLHNLAKVSRRQPPQNRLKFFNGGERSSSRTSINVFHLFYISVIPIMLISVVALYFLAFVSTALAYQVISPNGRTEWTNQGDQLCV